MISQPVMDALQAQFTLERTNAAYYDAMGDALEAVNWKGSAAWMHRNAEDERSHAYRLAAYILDQNGQPAYQALEEIPDLSGDDLPQYFNAALAREEGATAHLKEMYALAVEEDDAQTVAFLLNPGHHHWPGFLAEQTRSEREITDILLELERLDATGWKLVDRELSKV
jgi:ferritin